MLGAELEGAELGESGTQVCSLDEISGVNGDGKLGGSLMGKKQIFSSEFTTKVGTSGVTSDVKVISYVGI